MDPTPVTFTFKSKRRLKEAVAALEERFGLESGPPSKRTLQYLDTFDWRLYGSGLSLSAESEEEGVSLRLRSLDGRTRRRTLVTDLPAFCRDLPLGSFRSLLESIVWVRRLFPLAEVELRVQEHWIRNKKGKPVVRLMAESGRASRPDSDKQRKLPTTLHIRAVRGHPAYFGRVVRFLRSETRSAPEKAPDLDRVLAAIGRTPEDYAKWIEILLDPLSRADAAMKEILASLLRTIQVNESGVRADLDTEFLHDLRVALRRTRSGLRRVKGVFLQKWADRFQDDFKWLAGTTNTLRDLDVLLIKLDEYQMGLSLTDRKNLRPLREFVLQKRSAALLEVGETLESQRYEELIERWQKFLVKPVPKAPKAPHATHPIGQVASKEIWSALRRVLKRGEAVEPKPTPETLHRLRIACKRLRYLLTFFRSLYPEEEMERLLLPLKELQDTLGTFNDLVIHRRELAEYATLLGDQKRVRKRTLRAMARLSKEMEVRQEAELETFSLRFASFTSPGSQAIYRRLFAPDD